ncbi:MAG TPA: FxsA family protein [Solirubrobacteraceae bacterium]
MLLPLVLLFIAVPIVEIYVIIQVGQAIGALWTIALLVADSILGSMLMRAQGRAAWRRFNEAIAAGRVPAREVLDGVLVIFGGALLLTPGFVTDAFGLAFLLPPTRAVIRRLLVRRVAGRFVVARPGSGRPAGAGVDVDGTASEVDPRTLP